MDPESVDVTAGLGGFLAFFLLAVALYFLMRNMNARMRRMAYRAQQEAEQATAGMTAKASRGQDPSPDRPDEPGPGRLGGPGSDGPGGQGPEGPDGSGGNRSDDSGSQEGPVVR